MCWGERRGGEKLPSRDDAFELYISQSIHCEAGKFVQSVRSVRQDRHSAGSEAPR